MSAPKTKNRAILGTDRPAEAAAAPAAGGVQVRAREALCEAGIDYAKGETFTTTADRAAALGPLVEPAA